MWLRAPGSLVKIDLHTHILPETWPDLHKRYGYGEWIRLEHHKPCCARMMRAEKFFREIEDDCWNPDRRIHDCDHHHVDVQVLSTVPVMFSYWARPEDTLDLSRMLNDHLVSVVARYPKRFIGLGTPDASTRACRGGTERRMAIGLDGAEIGTHINDWNGRGTLEPFWQPLKSLALLSSFTLGYDGSRSDAASLAALARQHASRNQSCDLFIGYGRCS